MPRPPAAQDAWPSRAGTSLPSATGSGSGPAVRERRRGADREGRGPARASSPAVTGTASTSSPPTWTRSCIVSAFAEPGLKLSLIDRYLVSAETGGVRPVIVFNKADLVDWPLYQWVDRPVRPARLRDDRHLRRRRPGDRSTPGAGLTHGVTAVSGQSGVGKSSLLNAIQPGLEPQGPRGLRLDLQGQAHHHHRRADPARAGRLRRGYTRPPPVRALGRRPGELQGHFVEFRPYIPHCRFPDCSHTHETAAPSRTPSTGGRSIPAGTRAI